MLFEEARTVIVQIRNVGTRNKGAELMLVAIKERFHRSGPACRLAVERRLGSRPRVGSYGLLAVIEPPGWLGRRPLSLAPWALGRLPSSWYQALGLAKSTDVGAVLDASGFQYGDHWGSGPTEWLARKSVAWRRHGAKTVLLPQAFGPFSCPRIRDAFRCVLDHADLVFARDRESYQHVQDLGGPYPHVALAPDFTNLVAGAVPDGVSLPLDTALIVPNCRMIGSSGLTADRYIDFLSMCAEQISRRGLRPVVLIHQRGDEQLVEPLRTAAGEDLPVITLADPVHLKGVIGRAYLMIGSRYHGLVSALSQAVPCLGAGWSHKYAMLFEEFDCPECCLAVACSRDELATRLDQLIEPTARAELVHRLREKEAVRRARVIDMWREVGRLLGFELIRPEATQLERGIGPRDGAGEDRPAA